jgi:hypothetical protein
MSGTTEDDTPAAEHAASAGDPPESDDDSLLMELALGALASPSPKRRRLAAQNGSQRRRYMINNENRGVGRRGLAARSLFGSKRVKQEPDDQPCSSNDKGNVPPSGAMADKKPPAMVTLDGRGEPLGSQDKENIDVITLSDSD